MTDETQPEIPGAEDAGTPPKAKTAWFIVDGEPVKADVAGREDETSYPSKKATVEAIAAAAAPPEPDKVGGIYLPSLPKGYAYVDLTVTGPDDVSISVRPTEDGKSSVTVETEDLTRTMPYVDFSASVKSTATFARTLEKRAARRAELAALDAEFGEG